MRGKESKAPPSAAKLLPAEVQGKEQNYLLDIVVVRVIFAVTLTLVAFYSHPFGLQGPSAIAVGLASALGIIYFLVAGSIVVIFCAAIVGAASITALFFGQRVAKDYPGAAALVPYFLLLIALLYLTNPFQK